MRRREFRLARTAAVAVIMLTMLMAVGANRDDVVQAQRLETVTVKIRYDGNERQVRTAQTSVGATLKEEGIVVGPIDMVTPATNGQPHDGMKITVVRVSESIEEIKSPIGFETVKTFTKSLRPGVVKVTRNGVRGEKVVRYKVRCHDGVPVMRTKVESVVVKQPVNKVVSIGSKGRYTSRGEYRTKRVLKMSASAYDPGPRSCGKWATGRTSCGMKAGYGVVAVDPDVISLGTRLYIEGYGHAIAGDVGRSIQGNRIDLGFDTYREAIRFGRKKVNVHILE
ncbi:G5 domain-containing protein [bacterium]|nr:G5 domain-containing protein [bacterium]